VEERYVDVFSAFIFQQSVNDSTEHFFTTSIKQSSDFNSQISV